MSLTITVDHDLAERLRVQAGARRLSVEQWALAILANASERPHSPETWTELNARRLALIRKRYGVGLAP
jgi:plasmid stability protein